MATILVARGAALRLLLCFWCGQEDMKSPLRGVQDAPTEFRRVVYRHLAEVPHYPLSTPQKTGSADALPAFVVRARGHEIPASRGARCTNRVQTGSLPASCRGSALPLIHTAKNRECCCTPCLCGAVSDDKSEPNASSISAKVIVFVPSL